MTAVGGFVDISELVFAAKAGSQFGYALVWVFALATVGIIVFSEMSGRVAAVAKQPVFNLMRHRLGLKLGMVTLAASIVSNLITCAAEIGGVSLVLNYLTGAPYPLMAVGMTAMFIFSIWVLPFQWIERVYGLLGLFMIVFAAALVAIHQIQSQKCVLMASSVAGPGSGAGSGCCDWSRKRYSTFVGPGRSTW